MVYQDVNSGFYNRLHFMAISNSHSVQLVNDRTITVSGIVTFGHGEYVVNLYNSPNKYLGSQMQDNLANHEWNE
jgi:hypothetical protein